MLLSIYFLIFFKNMDTVISKALSHFLGPFLVFLHNKRIIFNLKGNLQILLLA